MLPYREIKKSRSTLPLQPGGCTGPKSTVAPTSRRVPVLEPAALEPAELPVPAESSAGPVVPPLVELDEVDEVEAGAVVMPGPVENPGDDGSPQAATTRAAMVSVRMTLRA